MTLADRFLHSLTWRLYLTDTGISIFRLIRWLGPRIYPYTPELSPLSQLAVCPNFKVEVRPSTIAGAGHGLFALEDIPGDEVLGEYSGDRITSLAKWIRLRNKDYIMTTEIPNLFLDAAARPEVVLRYVNHNFDPACQNLVRQAHGETVCFLTLRKIVAGEELFVDYGQLYWKLRGVKSEPSSRSPSGPLKQLNPQ
jgi:hypothetical protein